MPAGPCPPNNKTVGTGRSPACDEPTGVQRHAHESDIPPLIQFAKRLKGYWWGIVSRVRWPKNTGQLVGINNRIKVIKRMAYGYRDSEFFFMKIKSVFPGNP
jgi:hypothetical protein